MAPAADPGCRPRTSPSHPSSAWFIPPLPPADRGWYGHCTSPSPQRGGRGGWGGRGACPTPPKPSPIKGEGNDCRPVFAIYFPQSALQPGEGGMRLRRSRREVVRGRCCFVLRRQSALWHDLVPFEDLPELRQLAHGVEIGIAPQDVVVVKAELQRLIEAIKGEIPLLP